MALGAAVEKLNCNSKMTLFSDQIDHEKHISDKACCNCCTAEDYPDDWRRRSISLTWGNPPMYTKSYVVLMVDEEKSSQDFVHWLVTDIPTDFNWLISGASANGAPNNSSLGHHLPGDAQEHLNSRNQFGYAAPCPDDKLLHYYRIELYARSVKKTYVDTTPDPTGPGFVQGAQIVQQLKADNKTLAVATLYGTRMRPLHVPAKIKVRYEDIRQGGKNSPGGEAALAADVSTLAADESIKH